MSMLVQKGGAYADLVNLQTLKSTSPTDKSPPTEITPTTQSRTSIDITTLSLANNSPDPEKPRLSTPSAPSDTNDEDPEPPTPSKSLWALLRGYAPALRPHSLILILALLGASVVGGAFSGEAVIFGNQSSSRYWQRTR